MKSEGKVKTMRTIINREERMLQKEGSYRTKIEPTSSNTWGLGTSEEGKISWKRTMAKMEDKM